ncbi:MAG: glycosyl hydrolase family 28 protein [Verrucomicrobiia bacterium]|jgi:polygalacturonase/PKD repeat protein
MRRFGIVILASVAVLGLALPSQATVYLNQTNWTNGNRTSQNLPTTSAWFASSLGSLTTSGGALVMKVTGSSGMAITYFTPTTNSPPIQLNVGDTFTATFGFTFNGVPTPGSASEGFRIGLFDFANGSNVPLRVTNDGSFSSSSQGLFVQGYALFGKVYGTFADNQPIDIRKRTLLSDSSLLGASGDWISIAKDQLNTNSFDGFANLTPYSLQFVLQRTNLTSLVIAITWSNFVTGATLSDSTTDYSATNFSFDGIAYRPGGNTEAPVTNDFTQVEVQVTSAPVAPSIITQPQDQDLSSGQTATFTVGPNGTLPLFYQWYYNTNSPVASATNTTLVLTNVQIAAAGGYSVLISNAYGSVTSVVATLAVTNVAPFITTDLQNQTVIPGQSATFTVVANGSQPLSYQWYENTNTLLSGATGSSFTLTNVQPADAGSYSVVVSNPVGAVTSSNAVLTVNTNPVAPLFLTQPASVSVMAGGNASFSATAIGTTPITYQWNQNGAPISGATSSNLNLSNVQFTNAGTYTLVASNSIGSTTSSNAILTVLPNTPQLPVIPATNFLITSYGAVGDGVTDNSGSIQNTINAAAAAGGGTVEIPSAGTLSTYESGPITLSSSVNLQVDDGAMLQMLPESSWPGTLPAFISANGVHDIEISGAGTIDGHAGFGSTNWWGQNLSTAQRPDFINIQGSSSNILIEGVTLQNPPTFHMVLKGNNLNLTIQNLTINTPGNSPNTDGMDLQSTNVLIQNCSISDGDDNIEIGGSAGPAANITVSNCTFGTGHGLSIGSITSGGVHNLLVSNCTFNGTANGIRMKSDRDIGGLVQNLTYLDITMTNVGYPILIWSFYDEVGTPNNITPSTAAGYGPQPVITTTPFWQNILISNLTATANAGVNVTGVIWARQEAPLSNLTLYGVNIASHGETFDVYNAQDIQIINSQLTTDGSTNTLTLYNAQVTVTNTTPVANLVTLDGLTVSPTNNVLAFFNTQAAITHTNVVGSDPWLTLGSSTLTVNNSLNLGGTSTLNFGVGSNAAVIAVTSNLTLAGTLNVFDGGGFSNATYTLFTYTGALTYSGITLGATPNTNFTYTISTNTAGQVNLIVANPATPPVASFTNNPASGPAPLTVNFYDASTGVPTSWSWTFGDGTGTSTAQDPGYTYDYPGTYTVTQIVANTAGSSTNMGTITVSPYTFAQWQQFYGLTGASSGPNASYTGDGMSNTNKFMAGFNPTNAAAYLHVISIQEQFLSGNTNVVVTYLGANGDTNYVPGVQSRTNVLDYMTGTANGSYTNGGWQDTGQTNILSGGNGSGTITSMTDSNILASPTRFYRVRVLLP